MKPMKCYDCGKTVDPAWSTCRACGAVLQALCEDCGGTVSVFLSACPDCGMERLAQEYTPRRALLKLTVMAVLLVVLGFLVYRFFPRDERKLRWRDYETAHADYMAGRFHEASVRFEAYLQTHGEHPLARYMRGVSLFKCDREAEAIVDVRHALEADPDLDAASLFLATRALFHGRDAEVLRMAEQALAQHPRPALAHFLAGQVLVHHGFRDISRAAWHLRQAIDHGFTDPQAHLLLAEILMAQGTAYADPARKLEFTERVKQARERAGQLVREKPKEPAGWLLLARCLYALGEYEEAWVRLEMCRLRGGEGVEEKLLRAKLQWQRRDEAGAARVFAEILEALPEAETWLSIADFYRQTGSTRQADEVMTGARKAWPGHLGVLLQDARDALEAGHPAEAEQRLRKAETAHPREPIVTIWLAEALLRQPDRHQEALETLRRAADHPDAPPVADLRLADLLLDTPRGRGGARRMLTEAESRIQETKNRIVPGDPTAAYRDLVRGKLLLRMRHLPEAIELLASVTSKDPRDPQPHLLLAQAHEEADQPDLAALELSAVMRLTRRTPEMLVRRARTYLASGRTALALARRDLREALREQPGHGEAFLLLAKVYLLQRPPDLEAAEQVLGKALDMEGSAFQARLALGQLHLRSQDVEAAEAQFRLARAAASTSKERLDATGTLASLLDLRARERLSADARKLMEEALATEPDPTAGRLRYAQLLVERGDLEAAGGQLTAVLNADPESVPGLRLRFEILVAMAEPDRDELTRIADVVARLAPDRPDDHYLRGRLALLDDNTEVAAERLETALERAPRDHRTAYHLGRALLRIGDLPGARQALERAARLRPDLLPAQLLLAEAAFRQGVEVYREGSVLKTVADLRFALDRDPAHLPALALLARALYGIGREGSPEMMRRAQEACADLLESLSASNQEGEAVDRALHLMAGICYSLGDWEGLVDACRADFDANPEDPDAAHRLGLALAYAGNLDEAAAALSDAHRLAPGNWDLHRQLAQLHARAGRREQAVEVLRSWLDEHPEDAEAWMVLGWYSVPEEAESAYRKSLRLDANHAGALIALVELHLAANRFDDAERFLREHAERTSLAGEVGLQLGRVLLIADPGSREAAEILRRALTQKVRFEESRGLAGLFLLRTLVAREEFGEATNAARFFLSFARDRRDTPPGTWLSSILAEGSFLAGITLQLTGDPESAESCYRRTLLHDPDYHLALNNLADLVAEDAANREEEDLEEAVLMARRAVALHPELPHYEDTRGRALLAVGEPDLALGAFARALHLLREKGISGRREASALLGICRAQLAGEDRGAALEALEGAAAADPEIRQDPLYQELAAELRGD